MFLGLQKKINSIKKVMVNKMENATLSELINKELAKPNYLIEKNDEHKDKYMVIYFSSMGLFGKDNIDLFKYKIMEKNVFEFFKTRIEKASKHLFVRDLQQVYYSKGINNEINSLEKLIDFLKQETMDYKVITVGSSMGGYAATLFGLILKAEYVFSFSGQFGISSELSLNYNLVEMVKESEIPIYYMYPSDYRDDIEQVKLIKDCDNIHFLPFKSSTHGVPVIKDVLIRILNSDIKNLNKMYNYKDEPVSEKVFVLRHFGLFYFLKRMVRKNLVCLINKYFIKKHKRMSE